MNLFTKHPHSVGETYFTHLFFAFLMGLQLLLAGIACIIHSVFPFLFTTTGSDAAKKIISKVEKRKSK